MFVALIILTSWWAFGLQMAEKPLPDLENLEKHLPLVCFSPTPETAKLAQEQVIQCVWAHPGQYPPQEAYFSQWTGKCCFWDSLTDSGVFWAMGESVMSRVMEVRAETRDGISSIARQQTFDFYAAELMDIQTLDALTDEPVVGARVTVANDAVHFVSFSRMTDEDGYAVLPVIPGAPHVVTIRANRYLAPQPFKLEYASSPVQDENLETALTHVVELDPGISISGTVTSPTGMRLEGARLHIEIERSDIAGSIWHSDLDLPRTIEAFATSSGAWVPVRSSYTTATNGVFSIQTLPRGKMYIYASHADYAPSARAFVDTSDAAQTTSMRLTLNAPKRAYVRVENQHQIAIQATLTVIDEVTGHEMGVYQTSASGALELKNLPARARFQVVSPMHAFLQTSREIGENDEITLVLNALSQNALQIHVWNEAGLPVEYATVSLADAELQKKYPLCLGKTHRTGQVTLESCPSEFWMSIYHPDYAHQILLYAPQTGVLNVKLEQGHSSSIEMLEAQTNQPISKVQCTIETRYGTSQKRFSHTETVAVSDGILKLHHRPNLPHQITCQTSSNMRQTLEWTPNDASEKLIFPYTITRQILVLDAFGSTVPYARLQFDTQTYDTDEQGRLNLSAPPQTSLNVMHWLHGRTQKLFEPGHAELEIRLPDLPPQVVRQCLENKKIDHTVDSAAILISDDVPSMGLKRADAVEDCTGKTLTIVRDGRRMEVKI